MLKKLHISLIFSNLAVKIKNNQNHRYAQLICKFRQNS